MSQPESRLVQRIKTELTARGAFVFKIHGSAFMMTGLPDVIGCHQGRFIAIEAKMVGNKPSPAQLRIHQKIRDAGGRVVVAYSVADALTVLREHPPKGKR